MILYFHHHVIEQTLEKLWLFTLENSQTLAVWIAYKLAWLYMEDTVGDYKLLPFEECKAFI